MSGAITGLNISEAMAGLPQECDRDFAYRLFVAAERGFCVGVAQTKTD